MFVILQGKCQRELPFNATVADNQPAGDKKMTGVCWKTLNVYFQTNTLLYMMKYYFNMPQSCHHTNNVFQKSVYLFFHVVCI